MLYETGRGTAQNFERAAALYWRAAQKNNTSACRNLASLLRRGAEGVTVDLVRSFELYERAARCGDRAAQRAVGDCCREGRGVAQDDARAFASYVRAAEQQDVEAQCLVGSMLFRGCGTPRNVQRSLEWYEKAAGGGSERARAVVELIRKCQRGGGAGLE